MLYKGFTVYYDVHDETRMCRKEARDAHTGKQRAGNVAIALGMDIAGDTDSHKETA